MKRIVLTLFVFLVGCDHDEPDNKVSLPLSSGVYEYPLYIGGSSYRELRINDNGDVVSSIYNFDSNSMLFHGVDDSYEEGGELYILLTDQGWVQYTAEARRKHLLDYEKHLIYNGYFSKASCLNVQVESVAGNLINDRLGNEFSWASSSKFSEGARIFTCDVMFLEEVIVIESESCGAGCWEISPIGSGELSDWLSTYEARENPDISNGFYWLGLSMFFTNAGTIDIYSFFEPSRGKISDKGRWAMVSINGEEILEVEIPLEIKQEFGLTNAVNPIIAKTMGSLYQGEKYSSSASNPEFKHEKKYYLNGVASEDVKSSYIYSRE